MVLGILIVILLGVGSQGKRSYLNRIIKLLCDASFG